MLSICILLAFVNNVWSACQSLDDATLVTGFCAQRFPTPLVDARGMCVVDDGVLVEDQGKIKLLVDDNRDGLADSQFVVAQAAGLNHAVVVNGGYLYASSQSTVYRWPFQSGQRTVSYPMQTVITGVDADAQGRTGSGHATRSMAFDSQGRLYISVGSSSNVDPSSFRARIRRFTIPFQLPASGIAFSSGEVFADGLRNEVGLAFDRNGVLWGVENSADQLSRADLGGDIHNDNPAEELNRFPECCAGRFYGYPYCFTEYGLPGGQGTGTPWAWPSFMPAYNDTWCQTQTVRPALAMQAHTAPLGITFFNASKVLPADCSGGFPAWMDGDAFIGYHGSWNRDPPVGYKVVRVPMTSGGFPRSTPLNFFCHKGSGAQWSSGLRPVDVKFDRCNRLLISSDGTTNTASGTTSGAGVILVSWDCVQCAAGRNNPQCCSTRTLQNKQNIPTTGEACPGCLSSLPPLDTSTSGLWRSSCSCPDDAALAVATGARGKAKGGKKPRRNG